MRTARARVVVLGVAGVGILALSACSSGVREVPPSTSSAGQATPTAGGSSSPAASSTPSDSPTPAPSDTDVVFRDDFSSSDSGWDVGRLPSGTTFAYGTGAYVVVARGGGNHTQYAPWEALPRVAATATFVVPGRAPAGTAVGVTCRGGPDSGGTEVQFLVDSRAGTWRIELYHGAAISTAGTKVIAKGRIGATPAGKAVAITGRCLTQPGGKVTKVALLVGTRVATERRVATSPTDSAAWRTGLTVSDVDRGATTVRVTAYVLRSFPA